MDVVADLVAAKFGDLSLNLEKWGATCDPEIANVRELKMAFGGPET